MSAGAFQLVASNDPGFFGRGWQCQFVGKHGRAFVRNRVKWNNGKKIGPGRPQWYVTGRAGKEKLEAWFWSLEAALVWAQGELAMEELRGLE